MIDILKTFYTVHYNLGAVVALMLLVIIGMLLKKNFKGVIIFTILIVIQVAFVYHKTNNKIWTRQFFVSDEYEKHALWEKLHHKDMMYIDFRDSITLTFSTLNNEKFPWVLKDTDVKSDKMFHWCWVEDYWEKFAQTSLVDKLWGTEKATDIRGSSEERMDGKVYND